MAKIIGKTADGLLVSMTENEVAHFGGFYWGGAKDCPKPIPGTEIKISEMYKRLYDLEKNAAKLRALAGEFRTMADCFEDRAAPLIFPDPKKSSKKESPDD
jgi:hypothetical protein